MPIGAGGMSGANCQASPPSPSGTTRGTLSWNFFGTYVVQMWGGSSTCESHEIREYWRAIVDRPPIRFSRSEIRIAVRQMGCNPRRRCARGRAHPAPPDATGLLDECRVRRAHVARRDREAVRLVAAVERREAESGELLCPCEQRCRVVGGPRMPGRAV